MLILFGGTFDPPHIGHLALANALYKEFNEPITFLPTGLQNYKATPTTSVKQRLTMLKLSLNNDPRFIIDTREINSLENNNSYKTLLAIRKEIGINTPIFFLIGGDSLISLDSWDEWQNLLKLTNFVVVNRPEHSFEQMNANLAEIFALNKCYNLNKTTTHGSFYLMKFPHFHISSTQIRNNIQKNLAITSLVNKPVEEYIYSEHLYLS